MRFEVLLTADANRDLEDIYSYVAENEDARKADDLLDRITAVVKSLSTYPNRGSYPKELAELGILDYRQRFFKPYRIIYRVIRKRVYVYLIADGRRDFQLLLARRLLRP
ncbi:MAG: type II toxin-antitoxin system RelE/ParE family toxin [Candidatus Binatia bacterium]